MKKNTIIALVVAFVMVGAAVGFIVWDVKKNKADKPETTPGTAPAAPKPEIFPLKKGSKGEEVKALQRKLNEWTNYKYFGLTVKPPYQSLSVDGDFGSRTEANAAFIIGTKTVSKFQYDKFVSQKIVPDTVVPNPYLSDPLNFLNFGF